MYRIITSSRVHKKASWTEQSRKKMYLITYPMLTGSKQMQGQIPTLRVTWSCIELILSGSCGRLLDHANQGKFLPSAYLQSEVNCKTSSLRPQQELQKGPDLSHSHTDVLPVTVEKWALKACTKIQWEPWKSFIAQLSGSRGKLSINQLRLKNSCPIIQPSHYSQVKEKNKPNLGSLTWFAPIVWQDKVHAVSHMKNYRHTSAKKSVLCGLGKLQFLFLLLSAA